MAATRGAPLESLAADPATEAEGTPWVDRESDARIQFERVLWPLYAPLVRRLVLVLGEEADAEDVAQEAFLRAWSAWSSFDGRDARAWLYTIALRLAFNRRRSRRRWLRRLGSGEPTGWTDSSDVDLHEALRRLEPRVRAALLANAIDGYTQREIATMLGVREGTVASWIHRARRDLRQQLGMQVK